MTENDFCQTMAKIMENQGMGREEAVRKADQFFFRTTFDGQGGRGLDFRPSWGYTEAEEIVTRERLEQDEY